MTHYAGFPSSAISAHSTVTIGVFDGMHRGHEVFLTSLAQAAHERGHEAVVVTFDPHPDTIINPDRATALLITPNERIARISACGIDHVISIAFNSDTQALSASDFMGQVQRSTNLRTLWVGWDFALGRNREGNATRLREIGHTLGYETYTVPRTHTQTVAPSSSAIRTALQAGDITRVSEMLGRPHQYHGVVVHGDQRGRTIGFPTANLAVDNRLILPKYGVYAGIATLDHEHFVAVTNIGQRPTFSGIEPRIEAHLLDFDRDIYGRTVALSLHAFIRPEQRFAGIDALISQIHADVARTRTYELLK